MYQNDIKINYYHYAGLPFTKDMFIPFSMKPANLPGCCLFSHYMCIMKTISTRLFMTIQCLDSLKKEYCSQCQTHFLFCVACFFFLILFFCAGGRSNESNNSYGLNGDDHHYPVPPPPPPPSQVKRELPSDLSKEELIKEAEKVIAQTERIKCTVDTPSSLAGIRKQEKLLEGNFTNPSSFYQV